MCAAAKHLFMEASPPFGESPPECDRAERQFFASIRLSNGVLKTTTAHRLDDVNEALTEVFRRLGAEPRAFLDVAVSSGISTMEWFEALRRAGLRPSMTATDLTMTAYVVRLCGWWHALVDREGYPLHYDFWGMTLRPWSPRRFYVFGHAVLTGLCRAVYRRIAQRVEIVERLDRLDGNPPAIGDPVIKAQVTLVTRRLRECKDIELLDDDITKPTPPRLLGRFDVVRAANILNRGYFSLSEIRQVVTHLRERLTGSGALLVVARTEDKGGNHGSIFRLDGKGSFSLVGRIGRGSEIENVVLSL